MGLLVSHRLFSGKGKDRERSVRLWLEFSARVQTQPACGWTQSICMVLLRALPTIDCTEKVLENTGQLVYNNPHLTRE